MRLSNRYHIQLQKSICCRKKSEAVTVGSPAALLLEIGSSIAKFSRTRILKKLWERQHLLLKISLSVTNSEAATQRCSVKKVFLEISQNSQESTCARVSFFNNVADLRPKACKFIKKRLWHRYFLVKFAKFLRTPLVAASV